MNGQAVSKINSFIQPKLIVCLLIDSNSKSEKYEQFSASGAEDIGCGVNIPEWHHNPLCV